MKFIIHRTSKPWHEQPCEEAEYNEVDRCWTIELDSLNELVGLCHKYGKLIVDNGWIELCNYIEIYDVQREY